MKHRLTQDDLQRSVGIGFEVGGRDITVSEGLCGQMAMFAVNRSRDLAPKRSGYGASGLYPIFKRGAFGIGIRDWAYYMYYQDRGFDPFIMYSLEGKVIPMRIGGRVIFRYAKDVGGRQITHRDKKTGRIMTGNRPIKWRHPGLKPKDFIEEAMRDAFRFYFPQVIEEVVQRSLKDTMEEAFGAKQ